MGELPVLVDVDVGNKLSNLKIMCLTCNLAHNIFSFRSTAFE